MDTRVLEGVLSWGSDRPRWQQLAIRLLLDGTSIDASIGDLADLCIAGVRDTDVDEPSPLPALEDVAIQPGAINEVKLVAISDVTNVNALAKGQTLPFSPDGLTIVQGDNGSGKSGYARILKQVCRARSPQDVLPNAYNGQNESPSATITFAMNDAAQGHEWSATESAEELDALAAVSVYDSAATSIYIDKHNELAYRPFGLDLYDRLAAVCEAVKHELDERLRAHDAAKVKFLDLAGEHPVGMLISGLGAETAEADVDALATWSDQDSDDLRQARQTLDQLRDATPQQVAQAKRQQATRARALAERFTTAVSQLSDDHLNEFDTQRRQALSARQAAEQAAASTFDSAPLGGVGSDTWRRLWNAARDYSLQHAYPEQEFPATHAGARCGLCQQELADDARARMGAFDSFVTGHLVVEAESAEALRDAVQASLRDLDLAASDSLLTEIEHANGPSADGLREALAAADLRRQAALGSWNDVAELPSLPASNLDAVLDEHINRLEAEADALTVSPTADHLSSAQQQVDALEAQRSLAKQRDDVHLAIYWHKTRELLKEAKRATATRTITEQSARVTDEVVSEALLNEFATKLDELGAGGLPVKLEPQPREGQVRHRLELVGATAGTRPGSVLSEGERSVIALAAFFAEIDLAPDPSPVVLDDPVTSLDHRYRERVVHHLYKQAQRRQVVVFTHDQVFASELRDTFKNNDQKVTHHVIDRAANTGLVLEGPPWPLLNVRDRIRLLNVRCTEARQLWNLNDLPAYETHVAHTLELLREAWECAVEEVALNGTVQRFGRQVRTLRLSKVAKLTPADVAKVEMGMSLTSSQEHDQAPAAAQPGSNPDQVEQLVAEIRDFCRELHSR